MKKLLFVLYYFSILMYAYIALYEIKYIKSYDIFLKTTVTYRDFSITSVCGLSYAIQQNLFENTENNKYQKMILINFLVILFELMYVSGNL